MTEIPLSSDNAAFQFQIDLEGNNYTLDFEYNSRMDTWVMGIADTNGVPLVKGIPMQVGVDLFTRFNVPGLPPGRFFAIDLSNNDQPPGRYDLGSRVALMYLGVGE